MAIKVKLREKKIKGNQKSLYLDFYPSIINPATGNKTRRQFLNLYIYAPISSKKKVLKNGIVKTIYVYDQNPVYDEAYKSHNMETLERAEIIRIRRENEVNKDIIYNDFEKEQLRIKSIGEQSFLDFFKQRADSKRGPNTSNWISSYKYLHNFTQGQLRFSDLTEGFCDEFKAFLLSTNSLTMRNTKLSRNTSAAYFNKFKETLKHAYRKGLLQTDLNAKVDPISEEVPQKNTLTIEELNKLAKTDCPSPILRRAALFFALTGLPFMEMKNLLWKEVHDEGENGIFILTKRQKTEKDYEVFISEQAYQLLGERKQDNDLVFDGLSNDDRYTHFPLWLAKAGITKKMTFHDLRHTYGTNQIDAGTDIFTLKGNMSHQDVKYTQRYSNESKRRKMEAAEKVKLDL